ncbi:hypothetical protein AB8Z38_17780 [Bradyrhizobium sp. LLZ17]|uniref:Uncharacterized protein n=1 Tax=Bradyrhizobium sp. LLZ17 TaxID=3239388 RepID=A0AB39XXJ6_9BRAD
MEAHVLRSGGPDVDRLQFRAVTGRPLGQGNPLFSDVVEGLAYANRHLPNRDRSQGDVTTLQFAPRHRQIRIDLVSDVPADQYGQPAPSSLLSCDDCYPTTPPTLALR